MFREGIPIRWRKPMLALLVLALTAAFPVRGVRTLPIDSAVILERDTIRINSEDAGMECFGNNYIIRSKSNPQLVIDSFPGVPFPNVIVNVMKQLTGCYSSQNRPLGYLDYFEPSKYLIHGNSNWALWVDSVFALSWTIGPIPLDQTMHPGFRWRWARIDGSPEWVRWTDTVHLSGTGSMGDPIPLLSFLDSSAIDSVVPALENRSSPTFGQNLTLQEDTVLQKPIQIDTFAYLRDGLPLPTPDTGYEPATLTWASTRGGATLKRTKSRSTLPMGSTIYVTNAGTDSVGVHLWHLWSGGAVTDSFWVERPRPASVVGHTKRLRVTGDSWTIDGRKSFVMHGWNPRYGASENGKLPEAPLSR
jgi:hypothetical protein